MTWRLAKDASVIPGVAGETQTLPEDCTNGEAERNTAAEVFS
jgi:hypothetical protein